MDNIDILDSKVKDIINTKGELENKIEVLEIKVKEYNEIIKSLEDKNRLYKNELKNVLVELENVIKDLDV
jgi:peptidoglycan hydrolase CwlO-like protein|tara:strand:- start:191 stop:400 length:210 start_codon:yes stop_codon:yes gene_type:complete